jgi:hypothetical protein
MKTGLIDAGETPLVMNPTSKFYIICSSTISATRDSPVASQQKTPLFSLLSNSKEYEIARPIDVRLPRSSLNCDIAVFPGIASTILTFPVVHMVGLSTLRVDSAQSLRRTGGRHLWFSDKINHHLHAPHASSSICFHRQAVSCRLGARPDQVETGIRNAGPSPSPPQGAGTGADVQLPLHQNHVRVCPHPLIRL